MKVYLALVQPDGDYDHGATLLGIYTTEALAKDASVGWEAEIIECELDTDMDRSTYAHAGMKALSVLLAAFLFVSCAHTTVSPSTKKKPPVKTATFTVVATGTPPLSYQWQSSSDYGVTWTTVNGATSASLTVPATTPGNNMRYRVVVRNAGGSVVSNAAVLTVLQ